MEPMRVILLPGAVLPAQDAYGALIEALGPDVQAVAKDVMAHRLTLGFDAIADNISPTQVVERIIAMVPPPTPVWQGGNGAQQPAPQGQQQPGPQNGQQGAPNGQQGPPPVRNGQGTGSFPPPSGRPVAPYPPSRDF